VGGEEGLCSDAQRMCCIVQSCKIPPTNVFVECCTVRVMGPPKTREVAVAAGTNFGYDTRDDGDIPSVLMMNHAYQRVADAVWDLVPDSTDLKITEGSKVAPEAHGSCVCTPNTHELPISLKM